MSVNVAGSVEVPLTVFGSLVTEMAAPDCPEGTSPDNGDVVYAPGNVASRPALQRVFPGGFAAVVTFLKSFRRPNGQVINLYLDTNGVLWWEDFTDNPAQKNILYNLSTSNPFAKSVTAFGREYIAFSDGVAGYGTDKPIQYDGTNIDPVTQDGPGTPPVVTSVALPSVAMATTGGPTVINLTECDPAGQGPGGSFSQINCFTNTNISGLINVGSRVTIAGNGSANMNQSNLSVIAVYAQAAGLNLFICAAYLPAGTPFGLGGTGTATTGITMSRAGNIVTVTTATAHQLQPGYQAQITGVTPGTLPVTVNSIVINNEDQPGLALVTTSAAHGLVPGINVTISGVNPVQVGGHITGMSRVGGVTTVTMSAIHNLSTGAIITIQGAGATFNTTAPVSQVISPQVFIILQTNEADGTDAGGAGETVLLNWPIPATTTPDVFQVQSVPSLTTFYIQISYSDGTWGTGATLMFPWDGTFFVATVPTTTSFTYQQYGPNMATAVVGAVTPYGQASPGLHQCQVLFLTRNGYITRPSPPTTFFATGGQYVSVSNIPIGPANVVARILAFTGAGGAYFFYIPVPAQVNNQLVSTATQINDNTTTGTTLDFSDNTLFSSLGISIPGNNIANQITIMEALGFGFYGSRLITWGQRNRIQNLLNTDFMGGTLPTSIQQPTGWKATGGVSGGVVQTGGIGSVLYQFLFTGAGSIFQGFYQDAYGAPIASPNALYTFRARVFVGTITATISSASTAFTASASITQGASSPAWKEAQFIVPMPAVIPSDMILTISGSGAVTGISIIYTNSPQLNTILFGSYINNPEAFDGVSGKFGPVNDSHKMFDMAILRNSLYFLTQDPSGRIHQTSDNGTTEPAGWTVNEVGANCGLLSPFCLMKSQADDASAGGGEEWLAWSSASGARIFGGDQPWKISQEIQPDWDGMNTAFLGTTWAVNDPVARVMYFGLPVGTTIKVYVMNYRELDTPQQIAMGAPYHPSFSGHLIATDNTRKWTRWNRQIGAAALMYRGATLGGSTLSMVFSGWQNNPGFFSNVYTLNPAKLTDDDFGLIAPYYTTYFFVGNMQEAMLRSDKGEPLGSHRKLLAYLMAYASGTGLLNITVYGDNLNNPWPLSGQRSLVASPNYDLEWTGGNAYAQRFAIKFASVPVAGQTDNGFSLQKVVAALRAARHAPVRGAA